MKNKPSSLKEAPKAAQKDRKKGLSLHKAKQAKATSAPNVKKAASSIVKKATVKPIVEVEEVSVVPTTSVTAAIDAPVVPREVTKPIVLAPVSIPKQIALTWAKIDAGDPIYNVQLDGKGGARNIRSPSKATSVNPFWIHFDYSNHRSAAWIQHTNLLPDISKAALIGREEITNEIRFDKNDAMLVILKGVNITPGNKPDPIVSLRFYITSNYIISTRHECINAILELKGDLDKNIGPVDVADWLVQISDILADYTNNAIEELHSQVIQLENTVLSHQQIAPHRKIGLLRQQLILLRRNTTPQRDIFIKISTERLSWIDDNDRQHMHDAATRMNNYISDIDGSLLRISTIVQQINALLTESINKRIYLMSIVATLFMPLTFFASLLGMNLAGIPFTDKHWAFGTYTVGFIIFGIFLWIWLRKKQWI